MNEFDSMEELAELPEEEEEIIEVPKPHFISKTTLTGTMQYEAAKATQTTFNKILTYACFGILVVLLGVTVWQYVVTRSKTYLLYIVVVGIVALYMAYSNFFGRKRSFDKWEQQVRAKYGTDGLHLTAEFYDLTFLQTVEETENEMDGSYSSIDKILETDKLFLLRCGKTSWYFIEKSGLSDVEAFSKFIHEKCGV